MWAEAVDGVVVWAEGAASVGVVCVEGVVWAEAVEGVVCVEGVVWAEAVEGAACVEGVVWAE